MFLKNRNIRSKIKRSKVTDYAALNNAFPTHLLKLSVIAVDILRFYTYVIEQNTAFGKLTQRQVTKIGVKVDLLFTV